MKDDSEIFLPSSVSPLRFKISPFFEFNIVTPIF